MTYSSVVEMAGSIALRNRITAAAASEGATDPATWTAEHIWEVVAAGSDWAAPRDSARASSSDNWNPDTGARDDVITDAMILSVVQPMVSGAE